MKDNTKPTFLNYLAPLIMIAIGARHYFKHGLDVVTIITILLGCFALYLVLFNHRLLQEVLALITKLWYPIGQLITVILLTVTFYIIFAPVGLLLRLFKKDILNRNFRTDCRTYWLDIPKNEGNDYRQQF